MFLLNKIFVFAFIFSCLFLGREAFRFVRALNTGNYETGKHTVLWIGVCIAYVLTMLITGFIL